MWVGEGRLGTWRFCMAFAGIFIRWETSLVGSCGSADSACVEGDRVGRGWTVSIAATVCVAVSAWCFTTFVREAKAYTSGVAADCV